MCTADRDTVPPASLVTADKSFSLLLPFKIENKRRYLKKTEVLKATLGIALPVLGADITSLRAVCTPDALRSSRPLKSEGFCAAFSEGLIS